uniref:MetQ/NlpA family ABC transporter substrate-binding protein n=1 Tax=Escherichia coli TaxID=562 RepID=UPI0021E268F9
LFMEGPDSPYVNAIVAREDNKDSKKIQELKAAFQPSEVAEKEKEVYKGDAIKGW